MTLLDTRKNLFLSLDVLAKFPRDKPAILGIASSYILRESLQIATCRDHRKVLRYLNVIHPSPILKSQFLPLLRLMASMHIDGDKSLRNVHATEASPAYTPADEGVFDERISHVAKKYRGTTTDQHG